MDNNKKIVADLYGEIWIDIIGWEGVYQISNLFRIKGVLRVVKHKNKQTKTIHPKIITPFKNSGGYLAVKLNKDGVIKTLLHHRLIGIHFIPNPNNKPQINHKNGIKTDNRVDNLEWCTIKENQVHSWEELGRVSSTKGKFDKDHPNSKIVRCLTLDIQFNSSAQASRSLGISQGSISNVCKNKRLHADGMYFQYI